MKPSPTESDASFSMEAMAQKLSRSLLVTLQVVYKVDSIIETLNCSCFSKCSASPKAKIRVNEGRFNTKLPCVLSNPSHSTAGGLPSRSPENEIGDKYEQVRQQRWLDGFRGITSLPVRCDGSMSDGRPKGFPSTRLEKQPPYGLAVAHPRPPGRHF